MAMPPNTPLTFGFLSVADFEARVSAETLVPGRLYFVGSVIYLATSNVEYESYGGSQIGTAPTDPEDAEEGVWYYDPASGVLKIAIKMQGGDNAGEVEWMVVIGSGAMGSGANTLVTAQQVANAIAASGLSWNTD